MANRALRFIHASDIHLEGVSRGFAEVPDHLREVCLEAGYRAAMRVFDAVLAEEADLLVLAGDILHVEQAGPRGPLFLTEQFARLAARGIAVYWAGGSVDPPESWPAALPLPDNVHVFGRGRVSEYVHTREGVPLARLIGISHDSQRALNLDGFDPDPAGLLTIGVAHAPEGLPNGEPRGIHYWALGGLHNRTNPSGAPHLVHYPGSPQARGPEESGAHGCTLVQVDGQGQVRTSTISTDVLRWHQERVTINESTSQSDLEAQLSQRMQTLIDLAPSVDLLVAWTIAGSGPLAVQLRRAGLAAELLDGLRRRFGQRSPAAWSVSLAADPPAALPRSWYEQETIRADYLRAVRQLQMNPSEPLGLEAYLADVHEPALLRAMVAGCTSDAARQRVLQDAAALGVDLLGGEDAT